MAAKKTTSTQFELMLNFFEIYPMMMSGNVDSMYSKDFKNTKWEELRDLLNTAGDGPCKTAEQWKKTWIDWKSNIRKKVHTIQHAKEMNQPLKEELSPMEQRLMALLAPQMAKEKMRSRLHKKKDSSTLYKHLREEQERSAGSDAAEQMRICEERKAAAAERIADAAERIAVSVQNIEQVLIRQILEKQL